MKKSRSDLEFIESRVKSTHNNWASRLVVNDSETYDVDKHEALAYCYKFVDSSGKAVYNIVDHPIGDSEVDFRIYMHEIGHIYLGHLDEICVELDNYLYNTIRENFYSIAERINANCGIDFGDVLLKRIIDDPYVNHSFHNIAMDMEVNTKVLSSEDIEFMQDGVTKVLPKKMEETLKLIAGGTDDPELKKELEDKIKQLETESKIKFMLPKYYHTSEIGPDGKPLPFPDGLTYTEYLILMLNNADQFVKMLVSLSNGSNGDTSGITQQQIQNALQKWWNQQSDEYKNGYNTAMNDLRNGTVNPPQAKRSSFQNQQGVPQDPQNQQGNQQGSQGQSNQQGSQSQQIGSQSQSGNSQGQPGESQGQQGGGSQGQQGQGGQQGQQGGGSQGDSDYERGYQDALRDAAEGLNNSQGQSLRGLSSLMNKAGLAPDPGQKKGEGREQEVRNECPYDDLGKPGKGNIGNDHFTAERQSADEAREEGNIDRVGGSGCGKEGGSDATIGVDYSSIDDVDAAIKEIMRNVKRKVVKITNKRDKMRLYNRGIVKDNVLHTTVSQRVNLSCDPKIVFLIDVSSSMDTRLIKRVLKTISYDLYKLNRSLKYDIIAWNTCLSQHLRDIKPKEQLPNIRVGGGTEMADGMVYFKENYDKNAILVLISDFEDSLSRWHEVEDSMVGYEIYAWNYGRYTNEKINWTRLKQRDFSDYGYVDD